MLQNTSFLLRIGSIAVFIVVAAVGVLPLRLVAAGTAAADPAPAVPPQAVQPAPPRNLQSITADWTNVDITVIADAVGAATGISFIVDQRVRAKVSFHTTQPMTSQELYSAFLNLLQVNGYAAVPVGNKMVKIVPEAAAGRM